MQAQAITGEATTQWSLLEQTIQRMQLEAESQKPSAAILHAQREAEKLETTAKLTKLEAASTATAESLML